MSYEFRPKGRFRKLFVVYPRGLRTGGPEALHQLVHTLREYDQQAFLVPTPETADRPRISEYEKYDAPECAAFEDAADTAVVVPEVNLQALNRIRRARRFCWWLSIDNSPIFRSERELAVKNRIAGPRYLRDLRLQTSKLTAKPAQYRLRMSDVIHLTQSYYAWSFLNTRLNVLASSLSDFISVDIQRSADRSHRSRPIIAYNATKGRELAESVRESAHIDAEWIPIRGMSQEAVHRVLTTCDVFLDLGFHPGKDRLPREAVTLGAVAIVARQGAGAFFPDVPIPWEHKVTLGPGFIKRAQDTLLSILSDIPAAFDSQSLYRAAVAMERQNFRDEVRSVFLQGRWGEDLGVSVSSLSHQCSK